MLKLLGHRLVTALASDYVPASMLDAAFLFCAGRGLLSPAGGEGQSGRDGAWRSRMDRTRSRAGLVQVRVHDGLSLVRRAWMGGKRVT